jgi:tripeptidyl-peptidase I
LLHNPGYKSYAGPGNGSFGAKGGLYNRNGRGYPDVSANGDNIAVYNGGRAGLSGGTSAATPIFASIVNRINEERLAAGKKSVGFVNPVLYANPWALNDITNGSNPNCGTQGFSAVKGWDPVTGLGTPNYPKLLSVFMGLP